MFCGIFKGVIEMKLRPTADLPAQEEGVAASGRRPQRSAARWAGTARAVVFLGCGGGVVAAGVLGGDYST